MKKTAHTTSQNAIDALEKKLKKDKKLNEFLLASLKLAKSVGKANLDKKLFKALDWPTTDKKYIEYLTWFSQWIPQQSTDPAWTDPGTDEQQEVYDRLCHFYWLIDQEVNGKILQNNDWFSEWLVDYANLWGTFLDSTDSFNQEVLDSFINDSPKYRVKEDSMIMDSTTGEMKPNAPSGWLTFNQFFARELNPGLRPITQPFNNAAVTAPADCTYRAQYHINADSSISNPVNGDTSITLKKTHTFGNIKDLLEGSVYREAFANGKFVHYFLGPYSYHRFHTPVSGIVKECYPIHGKVFLDVNVTDQQFDAPDNSTDGKDGVGYEFTQARGVITIDTTNSPYGDVGIVAIIPIGMCQVSSVHMTATPGSETLKGDEFGYFLFGGSDIIVLFQEHVAAQIDDNPDIYRHFGTLIARLQEG